MQNRPLIPARIRILQTTLLLASGLLTFALLTFPFSLRPTSVTVDVGDVAPRDLQAPRDVEYVSEVLTEEARQGAERAVQPVYAPPDPAIARQQIERMRTVLQYITLIREDPNATPEQKQSDLAAISDIRLDPEIVPQILELPAVRWEAVKQEALNVLEPYVQRYKAGETIVAGGQVITEAEMEALRQLGMITPGSRLEDLLGTGAITIVSMVFVSMYFSRRRRLLILDNLRNVSVIAIIFLVFLAGARMVIPERTLVPYFYPLSAAGLLISTLFGIETGIAISMVLSILAVYGLPNASELAPFFLFTSWMGLLLLGQARRFWAFLRSGIAVALSGAAMIVAYNIPVYNLDPVGIIQLMGAVAFNGLASASVALSLQYLLAQSLGLTTALQLLDVSRPDSPLLQFFLRNAPGTYQHSLQVANLAEQAAERIGADPLLTRVGAQFHDVGKANNPSFFIENQLPGKIDKHDDMLPEQVAATIIRHVHEGVAIARKYRLPHRLIDFMLEHHGTLITRYQYNQAIEAAGGDASKVNIENFRYPGPRPGSRETALLMLADAVEARARAESPANEDELRLLVRSVIDSALKNSQLDDTSLTLRDLNMIVESFVTTLRGQYHPRIQYPKADEAPALEDTRPNQIR
jgi:putative nucleotidyltransferase with HDIG domain